MAKRNAPEVDQAKEQADTFVLRVVLDPTDATPTHYANYAEVGRNAYDIGLAFARLPVKLSRAKTAEVQQSGELVVEPFLQIMLPPAVAKGLINALRVQLDSYEQQFGETVRSRDPADE